MLELESITKLLFSGCLLVPFLLIARSCKYQLVATSKQLYNTVNKITEQGSVESHYLENESKRCCPSLIILVKTLSPQSKIKRVNIVTNKTTFTLQRKKHIESLTYYSKKMQRKV